MTMASRYARRTGLPTGIQIEDPGPSSMLQIVIDRDDVNVALTALVDARAADRWISTGSRTATFGGRQLGHRRQPPVSR